MSKEIIDSFCPTNKKEWRAWLEINHIEKDFIWLIIHKQNASKPTITWSEAVDEALCFGWIDSTKKSLDTERYIQYFGKRRAKSTWSKVNKIKVARLIKEGLISEAGLKSIEIAKENGSWTILDDVEDLIIPEDLEQEFDKRSGSLDYFISLNKSIKKGLLYWIISAKRPETRRKRILELADDASQKRIPKKFR